MQPACKAVDPSRRAERPTLSDDARAMLARKWAECVAPHTGMRTFEAMAAALAEDHAPWRQPLPVQSLPVQPLTARGFGGLVEGVPLATLLRSGAALRRAWFAARGLLVVRLGDERLTPRQVSAALLRKRGRPRARPTARQRATGRPTPP